MALEESSNAEPRPPAPLLRKRVLFTSLLLAFCCYGFFQWVLWPVQVVGDSMLPAYRNGTRNLINKLAYSTHDPQRSDVVALRTPPGDVWIKRIVGLPGERVEAREGKIVINGQPLPEPYTDSTVRWQEAFSLGPDEYFVIGDNRPTSAFYRARRDHIIGKVVF